MVACDLQEITVAARIGVTKGIRERKIRHFVSTLGCVARLCKTKPLFCNLFVPHIAFLALRVEIVELEGELPVGLVDFVVLCIAAGIRCFYRLSPLKGHWKNGMFALPTKLLPLKGLLKEAVAERDAVHIERFRRKVPLCYFDNTEISDTINRLFLYFCNLEMFNMTRSQLIEKNKELFWYTPEERKQDVSDSLLVETLLNYGTLDDYRDLISALGGRRVAKVFFSATGRQKDNYYPEIYHFFSLILAKYA